MGDKYYKWKHRIDFYLEENGITDFSDYRLGKPATTGTTVNIEHWGYTSVPVQPTYQVLKELVNKPNFRAHMYKNMLIHKQDFILCVMFPAGDYQDTTVLYNKFKDYPYIWHTIVETGAFFSDTAF